MLENKNYFSCDEVPSRPSRRPVPSLFQALKEAKEQVEYECFATFDSAGNPHIDPIYKELCLIIAEVYVKSPESYMRIHGENMQVRIVQEVFEALTHDHVELVVDNFKAQTRRIYNKTAYLQTSLYNSVFEIEAHYTNLVKSNGVI